ncbi:MAG: hypothetical protein HY459_04130 [Parcubacteria group bacterium]|nr:hypothetical protein [Parcubacteria group bacterium]
MKLSIPVLLVFMSIIGVGVWVLLQRGESGAEDTTGGETRSLLTAQTDDQGEVEITATPTVTDKDTRLAISLNTHSQELDEDITVASVLFDGNGNRYQALRWEGDPPSGHHRAGELIFPPLLGETRSIRLIISGIGGVPERTFLWNL